MLSRLIGSLLGRPARRRMSEVFNSCQLQPLEPRLLLSAVSGRVWLDANINGIQDPGESDLSGVTVVLYDQGGTEQETQDTDSDGLFEFTGVTSGTYYLQLQQSIEMNLVDHQLTFQNAEFGGLSLPTLDSDTATNTGKTANFTVNGTDDKTDLAAGYAPIFTLNSSAQVLPGQTLDFETLFAGSGYLDSYVATIDWGDGSDDEVVTPTDPTVNGQLGDLNLTFDFTSYDSNGFFDLSQSDGQLRRDLLQYAAVTIASRFGDTLSSITPDASNTWSQAFFAPDSDIYTEVVDPVIAVDEIVFYAGGRNIGSSTLGIGGPGGYSISGNSQAFFDSVIGRGQSGALGDDASKTDFALWGGTISFDTDSNWYYGIDDDEQGFSQSDFLSVAMHEMAHAMGFGTADSWDNLVSNDTFTGTETTAYYGSAPPVDPLSDAHFDYDTDDPASGQEAAMDPNITTGTRKYFTELDFAVMDDIGWDLLDTFDIAEDGVVAGSHSYSTAGTKTITVYLLNAEGKLATYSVDIEVLGAIQVVNVEVNAAGFDTDDPGLSSPNFSQSIQRSVLHSVVVEFSRAVDDLTTADIQLKLIYQDGTTFEPDMSSATFASDDGNVTVEIDLRGVTLEDGVYELFVFDTVVDASTGGLLDGDADTFAGGTYQSSRFHQFAGDFNGDATFNIADLGALQHYWNGNTANPPSYIDVSGDDDVNADDLADFQAWMSSLDLTVEEQVESLEALSVDPPTPSANMAMALAAYQNKQATLSVVDSDDSDGDAVEFEDIIGQWLG